MTLPRLFVPLLLIVLLPARAADVPNRPAVASAHPLASAAGIEIMEAGGNAFDAAVAVSAALTIVAPYGSGLGGGGFWLLQRAEDRFETFVDGRETAPMAATVDMYLDEEGEPIVRASREGPLAAGIPGLPAALVHIAETYGTLPLSRSLAPAIRLAREGFPLWPRLRLGLIYRRDILSRSPTAAATFLVDGEVPELGHIIVRPLLAETLERLAEEGRDGFYVGPVAEALVGGVRSAGGIWTLEDLAAYEIVEREPLVLNWRGVRMLMSPPPSSGGVAMANIFQILNGYDLDSLERVEQVHLLVEAMRRAYRDRAVYLGDPDFVDVPVARLTHPYYAAGQRGSIRLDRATPSADLPGIDVEDEGSQTTHFSVLDTEGNKVAGTQSLNSWFGCGYMDSTTGVFLNNEMDDFSVKPGVANLYELVGADANAIEPGKRMLSSMSPTILESERGVAILGTPGGSRIITMLTLATLDWLRGADAGSIVSRPRFHHQYLPDKLFYEPGAFTDEEVAALRALGHNPTVVNRQYGNMQVVTWDRVTGEVEAASDPRGQGDATVRVY
jgi:gamma-glutamyltranspeptidase/glutathione hydrolase